GLLREGSLAGCGEWDRYRVRAASGDVLAGTVHIHQPPQDFCATVEALHNAFLRVRLDQMFGKREASVWLSLYGMPAHEVDALRGRWQAMLEGIFPAATPSEAPSEAK
ncbi:MAG: hypothetical protein ACRD3R_13365, partial [Terriglobales bacterium]